MLGGGFWWDDWVIIFTGVCTNISLYSVVTKILRSSQYHSPLCPTLLLSVALERIYGLSPLTI
jgi:hypothetical protein